MNPTSLVTPRLGQEPLNTYQRHLAIFRQNYRKLPGARDYALAGDDVAERASVAFARAAWELTRDRTAEEIDRAFSDALATVATAIPSATQSWRPSAPPTLTPWVDPVSGEALANPFLTGDLKSQAVLLENDRALGEHLRAMAESPYSTVLALRDQEARRKELAGITYGPNEHKNNPFTRRIPSDEDAMRAQSSFIVIHHPLVVDAYKQEAQKVRWPWSSSHGHLGLQSAVGQALNEKRPAGLDSGLVILAAQIDDSLRLAMKKQAEAVAEEAAQRAKELAGRR